MGRRKDNKKHSLDSQGIDPRQIEANEEKPPYQLNSRAMKITPLLP
ncbi:hypothetical protein DB29_02189 [Shouchella clausii]|nr:hypothetical protein DB29_02189 [Shouchella clausii]